MAAQPPPRANAVSRIATLGSGFMALTSERPDERELMQRLIGRGLVDVHRKLEPDNADLFTWWAPWRSMKQRNIGWRLDLILASKPIADRVVSCVVQRDVGTSDHGPVVAVFDR